MSERMAARLSAQEEQIEALSREILRLQDGLTGGFLSCDPSLDALRAENEKLRYRALHLRRSLREEQQLQERDQSQRTSSQKSQNKPEELKEKSHAKLDPWPVFVSDRLQLYERLKKESDALLAERAAGGHSISVQLPDGQTLKATAWVSSPYQLACSISAHVLGEAMERFYGGCLCYGPPIENGFYYDMFLDGQKGVSSTEFGDLENICRSIMKDKQPFERLEISKETLLEMFKNSSTYWEGRSDMETLQRIYGISFPDGKMLKEWERFQEEAKNRDHRKIGKDQELFFFHDLSPGSCFFLPRGAYIYNTLTEFIREEYSRRGFQEVASPNIYNSKLWETSGHWQHYSENMFSFPVEQDIFALKPMNCPGHCLMFSHRPRSWRELPLRLADFGVLHRNELSGTLTGLTRVRRFQQDDAHIFCTMDQIESEMKGCLDFLRCVYDVFGFSFQLHLSTRPEKFLGDIAVWNQAEKQLENSLNEFGEPWKLNPGDGAFYGPKIDITIKDAIGRYHQCATIQLDFQLPIRFNLTYVGRDGEDKDRPVIIHRAILGSVERMIAILTENYAGKWPLWLSPRQVMLVPVNPSLEEYAKQLQKETSGITELRLTEALFSCDFTGDLAPAAVVGEKERAASSVNVRTRDNKVHGELSVHEVMQRLTLLRQSRCRSAEEDF
ncbi:hypothetical protein cypCar_00042207 [Cyprinus carpio]|nr:hypothetical protein cypCar_00042207 [Cyprinus carpio]